MRLAVSLAALLLVSAGAVTQRPPDPFVPVGVWYAGERSQWARDLPAIRSTGFNSLWTTVDWAASEPGRGSYRLDSLDQLLTVADEAKLEVIVQITGASPSWLASRYPDAAPVSDRGNKAPGYCLDHPGVRSDIAAFIAAVSARAASHPSFHAIDVWRDPRLVGGSDAVPPGEYCYCPHTRRRFREWLERKYVTLAALNAVWRRGFRSWDAPEPPRPRADAAGPDAVDWKTFTAARLHEDLRMQAAASAARGARPVTSHSIAPSVVLRAPSGVGNADDWWMAAAIDFYGTSAYPQPAADAPTPVMLTFAFDGIRSAGRERGWWLSELQVQGGGRAVTGADVRVWAWTALSRGARAIGFRAASGPQEPLGGDGIIGPDGEPTPAARAAGEFADLISSNAALFGALRPRASRVAIAYDPLAHVAAGPGADARRARDSMFEFYQAMFARNIQTDFIHPDEIATGLGSDYQALFLGHAPMLPRTVLEALKLYVRNGGALVGSAREMDSVRIEPDVRIDAAGGLVEARFLESADALLLIAINHGDAPQKVIMTFPPDVPEAIWQNMETGAAVNFVAGPTGPTYTRSFAPRDVVVLMIRKRWR